MTTTNIRAEGRETAAQKSIPSEGCGTAVQRNIRAEGRETATKNIITGFFVDLPVSTQEKGKGAVLSKLLPGLLPGLVIAGIVSGAMTPTEAGAFAVLLSILIGSFVYKSLKLSDIPSILLDVAKKHGHDHPSDCCRDFAGVGAVVPGSPEHARRVHP